MRHDAFPALERMEVAPELLSRLSSGANRTRLEAEILPKWLKARRWYAAKDADAPEVVILDVMPLDAGGRTAPIERPAPIVRSRRSLSIRDCSGGPAKIRGG